MCWCQTNGKRSLQYPNFAPIISEEATEKEDIEEEEYDDENDDNGGGGGGDSGGEWKTMMITMIKEEKAPQML